MDIFRANFPHSEVCLGKQSGRQHQFDPTMDRSSLISVSGTEARSDEIPGESDLSPSKQPASVVVQPDTVLTQLQWISNTMVDCDDPEEIKAARNNLDKQLNGLRQLYTSGACFATKTERARFFRLTAMVLRRIKESSDAWLQLEDAMRTWEARWRAEKYGVFAPATSGDSAYPWAIACENSARFPGSAQRKKVLGTMTGLLMCEHYLPRGGYLIMLDWYMEAEEIVRPILEAADGEARARVIAAQRPTSASTFDLPFNARGYQGEAITVNLKPCTERHVEKYAILVEDDMPTLAGLAARMSRRAIAKGSQHYVGLVWKKWLRVEGVRAEDTVKWHAWDL